MNGGRPHPPMQDLDAFTGQFTDVRIPFVLQGTTCFTPHDVPAPGERYGGVRLGEQRRSGFSPALPLLDRIAPHTDRTVVVNDHSAWLFLCDKNILKEGIVERNVESGLVLVLNQRREVLGYGKITGAGVTNLLDRGDYLRRER